jgi:hypothetical protein
MNDVLSVRGREHRRPVVPCMGDEHSAAIAGALHP